ncbi:MAG: hypothetical protein KDC44_15465, partial [Phaeodactylibacter sp.]|nr:hypothetical protein [Phaeodactylibacter sp.]
AGMVVGGGTALPASLGDALESTVFFVQAMKQVRQGDYHTAEVLLDEANKLIWKANARIVTGMAEGALEGTVTKGYSNSNGKWLTSITGKTGLLGNSKVLPTLSRYAVDIRTASGIFYKNLADGILKDYLKGAAGLDPFEIGWQLLENTLDQKQ